MKIGFDAAADKFYKKYKFKEFLDDEKHIFITIETIKKLFSDLNYE